MQIIQTGRVVFMFVVNESIAYFGMEIISWNDGVTNVLCGVPTWSVSEWA